MVLGSGVGGLAERAFAYGADKAYVVDDAALAQYTTDGFVGAAAALAKQYAAGADPDRIDLPDARFQRCAGG